MLNRQEDSTIGYNKKISDTQKNAFYNAKMRNLWAIILILFAIPVFADNYRVQKDFNSYNGTFDSSNEKILFILDFSNSMNEPLNGVPKVQLMLETMRKILPQIPPSTEVGLRVYGQKMGFTPFEACRMSALISPVAASNRREMTGALLSVKPRGMTPITYSLKQAVKNDFAGFRGKKRIILLTDGGENCDESPCKYAMELIKIRKDIIIDVIAFNIDNPEDLAQLECASLVTSGKFYTAKTAADLARSLNSTINVKKDVEAKILFND